jgi:hypothetical protein
MTERLSFGIALTASLIVAFLGFQIPVWGMPVDYHAMITVSIPLAIVWTILFALCLWRFGRRGWWAILGTPLALYWPVWLIFNHLPPCYYAHNCHFK